MGWSTLDEDDRLLLPAAPHRERVAQSLERRVIDRGGSDEARLATLFHCTDDARFDVLRDAANVVDETRRRLTARDARLAVLDFDAEALEVACHRPQEEGGDPREEREPHDREVTHSATLRRSSRRPRRVLRRAWSLP